MSEVNRILVDSNVAIEQANMSGLCFVDGLAISKSKYALEDHELSIYKQATDYVSVFFNYNASNVYEYELCLKDYGVVITGNDKNNKELGNCNAENVLIFLNGELLRKDEYSVLDGANIALLTAVPNKDFNEVIIYVSNSPIYYQRIKDPLKEIENLGYSRNSSLIFVNGKKISPLNIKDMGGIIKINLEINPNKDLVEFYDLNANLNDVSSNQKTESLNFSALLGYLTYGPLDDYKVRVPMLFDSYVVFDGLASLLIDNLRKGFFIKETDGPGSAIVVDTDYDKNRIKTLTLSPFRYSILTKDQYHFEVPTAKSIEDYLSEYDKKFTFLPEVLRVFQRVVLDEIQDSVARMRDLRNISRVDSKNINRLIKLLGFDLDIKHLNLRQRKELLEELNEFYRIAGTEDAYNLFNILQDSTHLVRMEQLFTPRTADKSENKTVYLYDFIQRERGQGYTLGEKLQIEGTSLIAIVKAIGENGEIEALEYPDISQTGTENYSSQERRLLETSGGATITTTATDIYWNYNVKSIGNSQGFHVGQVLATPEFKNGTIIVQEVGEKGEIKRVSLNPSSGSTEFSITNAGLYPVAKKLNLVLNSEDYGERELVYEKVGYGEMPKTILEEGAYLIEFSGAAGGGGAGDTTKGSTNDLPASDGGNGELQTTRISIGKNENKIISGIVGQGGGGAYARGGDKRGWGGSAGQGASAGQNGSQIHLMGIGNRQHLKYPSGPNGNIASGGGGGSTKIIIDKKEYVAKGGNGGGASFGKKAYIDINGKNGYEYRNVSGGVGGSGGISNGAGAKGGHRNLNDNSFRGANGQDGWIRIYKIQQQYSAQITGDQSTVAAGDQYKTTDGKITVNIVSVSGGQVTSFKFSPTIGYEIFDNYVIPLSDVAGGGNISIDSTPTKYRYGLEISSPGTNYRVGDFIEDVSPDGKPKYRIEVKSVDSIGSITSFDYVPKEGNKQSGYVYSNQATSMERGDGATVIVTSTVDELQSSEREYIDFYTKQELGAILHRDYIINTLDYGFVNEGSPNSPYPWQLGEPDIDYEGWTFSVNSAGETITDSAETSIDYGLVSEKIKGKWVEWWEWTRKKNYYPTNHVDVEINVLSGEEAANATKRFISQFYSLASTVLYIHRLITVYNFGNSSKGASDGTSMVFLGILTGQPITYETHTLTSDPDRQISA